MAVVRKTINFLPSVFRTDVNRKFLGSTLDQLINEPKFNRVDGYIGRRFGTTASSQYLEEPTQQRQDYQLEPSVVVGADSVELVSDYTDTINKLRYYGGSVDRHDRLFRSEYYSFDPHVNPDCLANYSQYYWMPDGPITVEISRNTVTAPSAYTFTGTISGYTTDQTATTVNPTITVVRGQTYTFAVNDPGRGFWIQSEPGFTGTAEYEPQNTVREVYGVTNNGNSVGTISFAVPTADAQDSYYLKPLLDSVDFATSATFTSLDGQPWTVNVTTIDGSTVYPQDRYVIFTTSSNASGDWTTSTGSVVPSAQRRGVWRITVNVFGRMALTYVRSIPTDYKVIVTQGTSNRGREFYNTGAVLAYLPPATAALTKLYYQNDTVSAQAGEINIVDAVTTAINVDTDIVGQTAYTYQGLEFSNGMRIHFDNTVLPSSYRNGTYIVEGVGRSIRLVDWSRLVAPEVEVAGTGVGFDTVGYDTGGFDQSVAGSVEPDYIVAARSSQDLNAWARGNRWFHGDVITASARFQGFEPSFGVRALRPIIEFVDDLQLYNSATIGMGAADQLFDSTTTMIIAGRTETLNDITTQINNKTFGLLRSERLDLTLGQHVIFANDVNATYRATRFRVDLQNQTAAASFDGTVTGTVTLRVGSQRAISHSQNSDFMAQLEPGTEIYTGTGSYLGRVDRVYNEYEFDFVAPVAANTNEVGGLRYNQPRVLLTSIEVAQAKSGTVVRSGTNAKKSYRYTGSAWLEAQQKTAINQAPLFDVIMPLTADSIGTHYYNSKFIGTRLFGYSDGTSRDSVLNLNVSYRNNSGSLGDIEFENYFQTDTFEYTTDINGVDLAVLPVKTGFLKRNIDRNSYELANCWREVSDTTRQYQHIRAEFTGETNYFEIGVEPADVGLSASANPSVKVYINNELLIRTRPGTTDSYSTQLVGAVRTLRIDSTLLVTGDIVDIFIYSQQSSAQGYYTIPQNLEYNPLNTEISTVTLGQLRRHVIAKAVNLQGLRGSPMAGSNLRDLDHYATPGTILQHSAPVAMASAMITDDRVNFFAGLDYARREYTRFKNKFLELSVSLPDVNPQNISASVDLILSTINAVRTETFPFYYSDMLATGAEYTVTRYVVSNPTTLRYNITQTFASNQASNRAVLIYRNGTLLVHGRDYEFDLGPTVTLSVTLAINDQLEIREYANTDGCFVPETPTKLGLYPKYIPSKYLDTTYVTDINVIQGHDGSLTPAFEDYRDQLLLELETRIYNNIKTSYQRTRSQIDQVIPGRFRTTDYTLAEFNSAVTTEFLRWVGTNQLNYSANTTFVGNNEYTWNYSRARDLDGQPVPGHWRGIYRYFYDTDRPHTHAWELLGHSVKPTWWDTYYSWTDNTKRTALISAVVNGYTQDPGSGTPLIVDPVFRRPSFARYVPVDTSGNLRSPLSFIGQHNESTFSQSWAIGDQGPVESAWRRSSEYPFALQRALAVLRPSYFGLFVDVAGYYSNNIGSISQYFYRDTNSRYQLQDLRINGYRDHAGIQRAAGYLNWIHGYLTNLGIDAAQRLRSYIDNIQVRLTHKLAAFSDKRYLNVLTEQYSPGSTNQSVIIPDESYRVHMNKSIPVDVLKYSAVIIQRTTTGYAVSGYDQNFPYFNIVPSRGTGDSYEISVLDQTVVVFTEYENLYRAVPYGTEFANRQQVAEFLVSYQRFLQSRGFMFDQYDQDLSLVRDFTLSIREFLTWCAQGWRENNVIVLSPANDALMIFSDQAQIDHIPGHSPGSRLMGVNFNPIRKTDFSVVRDGFETKIFTVSGQSIAFAELNLVQYEHVLVFDNTTIFNDIIYEPALGSRQLRLRVTGAITSDWDGQYTPPGFVYNDPKIPTWQAGHDYRRGDLVVYRGVSYAAADDLVAADKFDLNSWYKLDSVPASGLISNFATNAVRSENFYDIDNPPVDEEYLKFSSGILGFRNRAYLENLGINPTSQMKFYQGYIRQKGTAAAAKALGAAHIDGLESSLEIYEEWAARVGEYGALDANPEVRLILGDNITYVDPVTVEIGTTTQASTDSRVTHLTTSDLVSAPRDFTGSMFRLRPPDTARTFRIELFGDGIMCGRDPYYQTSVAGYYACLNDKSTGRVENPVDNQLFDQLNQKFRVSVTTRSRELSNSGQLLAGTDGVNGAWPDDIEADIVVINHGLGDARLGTDLAVYRQNLLSMRQRLRQDQAVVWVTPTKIDTTNPRVQWTSYGGSVDIAAYAQVMREVAAVYNDTVADAYNITNWLYYLRNNVTIAYDNTTVVPGDDISFTTSGPDTETIYYYDLVPAANVTVSGSVATINGTAYNTDFSDGVHPRQEGYDLLVTTVLAPAIESVIRRTLARQVPTYADDLVTAGTVTIDDIDAQLFDIANLEAFGREIIDSVSNGFKLWVAKDYNQTWQVYRLFRNAGIVTDVLSDLDRKVIFVCNNQHNLVSGDLFAIKGMNSTVDGFYQVFDSDEFTITVVADNIYETVRNFAVVSDSARIYDFQPLRFATLAARDAARPKHGWLSTDRVWIDDIGDAAGSWAVYERADKYSIAESSNSLLPDSDVDFSVISPLSQEVDIYYSIDNVHSLAWTSSTMLPNQAVLFKVSAPANGELYYTIQNNINVPAVEATGFETINSAEPDWTLSRQQSDKIDVDSVNELYLYSQRDQRILARLDLIDPNKGRILGTAQADIDYTTLNDPAKYSQGTNTDLSIAPDFYWAADHVGEYWWAVNSARFIDYEQGSLTYRLDHWGELFPGSDVAVYEWIESDVLPSEHVELGRSGTPAYADNSAYTEHAFVNPENNIISVRYYFWVRGRRTVSSAKKTHSSFTLASMIANPRLTGLPYAAVLAHNAIAVYNVQNYVSGNDTVLYVGYNQQSGAETTHTDYRLVQQGNAQDQLPTRIENKLIDSICGMDINQRSVPDVRLNDYEQIGLGLRPRQTLIRNRRLAVENLVRYVNSIVIQHAVASRIQDRAMVYTDNFHAKEPEPSTNDYDLAVDTYEDLAVPVPRPSLKVLVRNDETVGGYWTIREYNADNTSARIQRRYDLVRVQAYDTTKIWRYADWYAQGYSDKTLPKYTIDNYNQLLTMSLLHGDIVRVTNAVTTNIAGTYLGSERRLGVWELYQVQIINGAVTNTLIGLQNGTVQILESVFGNQGWDGTGFDSDFYDYNFGIELRNVIQGLKQDVFVNDLDLYYNLMMFYVVEYILTEQRNIDWMFKTSFISVIHRVRGLLRRPNFIRDRQDNYEDYLQEVKPYRAKIRQYRVGYTEIETPRIAVSDFDLPAYWDSELKRFRSPSGEYPTIDSQRLSRPEYSDWANNHLLTVDQLKLYSTGYGYNNSQPPQVRVIRTDTETGSNAAALLSVNSTTSEINRVEQTSVGSNYALTPRVDIVSTGGTETSDAVRYQYRVTSVGNANVTINSVSLTNLATLANVTVSTDGYIMHRVRRTDGEIVFTRQYNLAEQYRSGYTGYTSRDLATDLNATSSDFVVAVHTIGEAKYNRTDNTQLRYSVQVNDTALDALETFTITATGYSASETLYWTIEAATAEEIAAGTGTLPDISLDLAMYRCGASIEVFGGDTVFREGGAYALVGIPGAGEGHGIEIYSGVTDNDPAAFCSIDFDIFRGALTAKATTPRIVPLYSIESSANIALAASSLSLEISSLYPNQTLYYTVETATVDDIARVYSVPITFNTDITAELANDQPTRSALLVPVMANQKVRKLRTTMRFDRVATLATTQTVIDWVNGGFDSQPFDYESADITQPRGTFDRVYPAGSIIAYQGQAYRALRDIAAGPILDMTAVVMVGTDRAIDSRDYLHGYFQNANERILAYYAPSAGMEPKILERLVPGVGSVVASATSSSVPYTETVLIGDTFSSNVGISAGNIQVQGGGFVDVLFSYAPEELLPGMTYDTLSMRVINDSSTGLGFRVTRDISGTVFYHNVSPAYTTTLASDFNITDTNITVTNGSVLPPSATGIEPRVIYINGERVAYRTRTGNVLSDLRRSYGGTGVPLRHLANSNVEIVSVTTEFPAPTGILPI